MRDEKGFLTMLGFATKAHKLVSGDAGVESFLKQRGKINLLIIACDMPENRKKFWYYKAEAVDIKVIEASDKLSLGIAMGTSPRSVVGVMDLQMRKALLDRY